MKAHSYLWDHLEVHTVKRRHFSRGTSGAASGARGGAAPCGRRRRSVAAEARCLAEDGLAVVEFLNPHGCEVFVRQIDEVDACTTWTATGECQMV